MPFSRRSFLQSLAAFVGTAAVTPLLGAPKIPGWEDLPEEFPGEESLPKSKPRWTQITIAVSEGETIIYVDGMIFHGDEAVFVPRTGELMRVVGIEDRGSLTVARGTAGTTACALLAHDWVLRIS